MSADPTQGVNSGQLNAMLQAGRMGTSSSDEFFSRWLFCLLPNIEADQKPLVFETAAPFAFCQRNIFPMAQQMSAGNPNGILAKIIRVLQLQSIQDIKSEELEAMAQFATAGIEEDENFKALVAGKGAMSALNAQAAAMMPDTGGGHEIG